MPNNFKKKVTMSDIAECLGISKNAVSLALNNKPGVSDKLRRQISNLAAELDYRGFSGNSDGRGKCVLVVVSTRIRNDNYFYSEIFWSIEHEVKRIGATLITISVSQQSEDNLEIPTFPTEFSVLGLLVIGAFSEKYIAALSEIDVHMVSVDIPYNNVSISCVSSSNISASYVATKYLIECGHKKIGFIGSIHSIQSIYERWFGYCQAMAEYNLPINEDYNIFGERDSFYSLNEPQHIEPYFNRLSRFPTAWFCAGDRIAIAMINILSKRNIRVPDDVSIVGFDDIAFSKMCTPALTTIKIDRKKMGKYAVEMLTHLQSSGGVKEICTVSLPGKLVKRDSVKNIF